MTVILAFAIILLWYNLGWLSENVFLKHCDKWSYREVQDSKQSPAGNDYDSIISPNSLPPQPYKRNLGLSFIIIPRPFDKEFLNL